MCLYDQACNIDNSAPANADAGELLKPDRCIGVQKGRGHLVSCHTKEGFSRSCKLLTSSLSYSCLFFLPSCLLSGVFCGAATKVSLLLKHRMKVQTPTLAQATNQSLKHWGSHSHALQQPALHICQTQHVQVGSAVVNYTLKWKHCDFDSLVRNTVLHNLHLPWPTTLQCTILNSSDLLSTALHYTALLLHCTALHCTTLRCSALHCTALHYTTLQCMVFFRPSQQCDWRTREEGALTALALPQDQGYLGLALGPNSRNMTPLTLVGMF